MSVANAGLQRVANWIERKGLKLAPSRTEAVLLTTKRKLSHISFKLLDTTIAPKNAIRYFGVWLDSKLTFGEHINQVIRKAERTLTALCRLMPNIRGPLASKRRILACVAHSQLLYATPVWHYAISKGYIRQKLNAIYTVM
ncbi:uncharacterized protein LOC115891768 [Sitophilus oryzae]|uniref:Uncharacterized protein LOC115891768 n=1 Tax=Sitophilus oryzae TaxID=7048 RepID=A0A6J2YYD4_SITOR|nr:uncharacterized protein LOC115891768 [Sitophilus oryzae]